MSDGEKVAAIEAAIREYHAALNRREHGGVASAYVFREVERIIGIRWEDKR